MSSKSETPEIAKVTIELIGTGQTFTAYLKDLSIERKELRLEHLTEHAFWGTNEHKTLLCVEGELTNTPQAPQED